MGLEGVDGLLGATHVGTLGDELAASVDEDLGLLAGNFVLGSGGESDVDLADVNPGAGTSNVLELVGVAEGSSTDDAGELLALDLGLSDELDLLGGEATLAVDDEGALAVAQGDDGTAELNDLEGGVLGNVTGTGDGNALALEGLLAVGGVSNHVLDVLLRVSRCYT